MCRAKSRLRHLVPKLLCSSLGLLVLYTDNKFISGLHILGLTRPLRSPWQHQRRHGRISSFLRSRKQAVVVEGAKSEYISVRSGVPQGSVLGPCLFLVFINDLPEKVRSTPCLFADDTALTRPIASQQDHVTLQEDLGA